MKILINIKADKEVKEKAQKLAKEFGFPLSTIINASLKQFIRNRELHFSLTPKMSPRLEKILGVVERDIGTKKNMSPVFSSAKKMDNYLDSL